MDNTPPKLTPDEIWAFSTQVISIKQPFHDDVKGWIIYVESSLETGDLFNFVQFRFLGQYNVNDAYVVSDSDDGQTLYRFEVTPCQPNQR